jgi:hypothetical protein
LQLEKVLTRAAYTFFSMCMTSNKCRAVKYCRRGKQRAT